MDVSRRKFFLFMGAAAVSPIIHHIIPIKTIFDFHIPQKYIVPPLADNVFRPSPTLWALTPEKLEAAYRSVIYGYDEPDLIIIPDPDLYLAMEKEFSAHERR